MPAFCCLAFRDADSFGALDINRQRQLEIRINPNFIYYFDNFFDRLVAEERVPSGMHFQNFCQCARN